MKSRKTTKNANRPKRNKHKKRNRNILFPICLISVVSILAISISIIVIIDTGGGKPPAIKSTEELVKELNSGNYKKSYLAALELESHGKKGRKYIIKALASSDRDVRLAVAYTIRMSDLDYRKAVKLLIKCLDDEYEEVRWNSAGALGGFKSKKITQHLVRSLKDSSLSVKVYALRSLANICDSSAAVPIIEIMSKEKHPQIAEKGINYFERIKKSKNAEDASIMLAEYITKQANLRQMITAGVALMIIGEKARASLKHLDDGDEIHQRLAAAIRQKIDLGGYDNFEELFKLFNCKD